MARRLLEIARVEPYSLPEQTMDANHMRRQPRTSARPLALVVDDEPTMRKTARAALERAGFAVDEAACGRDAWQRMTGAVGAAAVPDILVIDAMLPDVHGFQIIKQMRERGLGIPVLAISAYYRGPGWADDVKESCGASAYLEKPFRMEQLVEAVARLHGGFTDDPTGMKSLKAPAAELARRGIDSFRKGDFVAAAESLRAALDLERESHALAGWLGLVYAAAGRDLQAAPLLERAASGENASWETVRNLALVCERAGFRRKALEAWARVLAIAPAGRPRDEAREKLSAA